MVLCLTRVGCADDSHDQLRPRRGSCGRVRRGGVRAVWLGRLFDRRHLRGIGWRHMKKKYVYKLAYFLNVVHFLTSAHFFKMANYFQIQVGDLFQVSALFEGVFKVRLGALLSSSSRCRPRTFGRLRTCEGNSFQVQVGPLFQVSALFQVGAHCFKSSLRTCSSIYTYIYMHVYETHTYTHIQWHSRVRSPGSSTHVRTHTYTRLRTNTHLGGGGYSSMPSISKTKIFHNQHQLYTLLSPCPSWSLSVCVLFSEKRLKLVTLNRRDNILV